MILQAFLNWVRFEKALSTLHRIIHPSPYPYEHPMITDVTNDLFPVTDEQPGSQRANLVPYTQREEPWTVPQDYRNTLLPPYNASGLCLGGRPGPGWRNRFSLAGGCSMRRLSAGDAWGLWLCPCDTTHTDHMKKQVQIFSTQAWLAAHVSRHRDHRWTSYHPMRTMLTMLTMVPPSLPSAAQSLKKENETRTVPQNPSSYQSSRTVPQGTRPHVRSFRNGGVHPGCAHEHVWFIARTSCAHVAWTWFMVLSRKLQQQQDRGCVPKFITGRSPNDSAYFFGRKQEPQWRIPA